MLSLNSRELVHIAGYTAKKSKSSSCCKMHIAGSIDMGNPDHEYVIILNRGGLIISSLNLVNYVWDAFAVLSVAENVLINQSKPTLDMLLKSPFIYDGMLQLHLWKP